MALWYLKLEIDDENGNPLTIDATNRGYRLKLREKNEHILTFAVRDISMDSRLVRGKRCRVFSDYNVNPATTKQFEGVMVDKEEVGATTVGKYFAMLARDFFKDRLLTKTHNKKHNQRKAGLIMKDIVTDAGSEFAQTSIEDTSVTLSEDYPHFLCQEAADILAEDSLTEYFCKPNLDVVFRSIRTDDSDLTIVEANVEGVSEVLRSIAEAAAEVIVIGGKDDTGQRVIARAVDSTLPAEIQGRKYSHHDQRYTTYQGAKLKALSILTDIGRDFTIIPPLRVKDITSLPRPGQLINLNFPNHGLTNVKVIVRQIELVLNPGEEGVQWIKFWLGETAPVLEEKIQMQQIAFERERARGILQADIATQQLLNAKDTLTISEGSRTITVCSKFWFDAVPVGQSGCTFGYDRPWSEYDV